MEAPLPKRPCLSVIGAVILPEARPRRWIKAALGETSIHSVEMIAESVYTTIDSLTLGVPLLGRSCGRGSLMVKLINSWSACPEFEPITLKDPPSVSNSWSLCKQSAISNKIPSKIKMDRLKFKLEIVEALAASPPTNKRILTDDEDGKVTIPIAKRSKCYNPPSIYVMALILTIPG
ncbi:uncharacterized protein TNCV_4428331 [Trichonephila clavipes]|nr:uncharacterized protein TNCV_4428331 [Trichonephila clavipes]